MFGYCKFKYFKDCKNLNDVKMTFRILAKKYHPDLGGDIEIFKEINNEYEDAFQYYQFKDNEEVKEEKNKNYDDVNIFRDIIEKLVKMEKINIEIVGSWLWVDGNTYPYKDILKNMNFRWSNNKKKWYYFENIKDENKKRGYYNYNQIVDKYGAVKVENEYQANAKLFI